MSQHYRISVRIEGYAKRRRKAIVEAARAEWPFEDLDELPGAPTPTLEGTGEDNLYGGEGEDRFAKRLAKAIRDANGKPCKVVVTATYLENLPSETYAFDA